MHTVILDFEGAEMSQTSSEHLRLFKKITDIDQNHYPEVSLLSFKRKEKEPDKCFYACG